MSEEKSVYEVDEPKSRVVEEKVYTVNDAVVPLLKHLEKEFMFHVWVTDKQVAKTLEKNKFIPQATEDFLNDELPSKYDVLVVSTSTLQDKYVEKCFEYLRPFALLLPLTALAEGKTNKLFNQHGIAAVVLDKPINFTGKKGKGECAAWFVWGVFSGNQVIFETM